MKTQIMKAAVAALFGGSMLIAAGAASATDIRECQDLITALQGQTAGAEFTGKNAAKDEAGLIAKLGEANSKLGVAKLTDASQKVGDYLSKLETLKVTAASFYTTGDLTRGGYEVLGCIADIGRSY